MPEPCMPNSTNTADLRKTVHSSLETIRDLLGEGPQSDETQAQLQQLEQLETLLMDQASRLEASNLMLEEFNYSVAHELFAPLRRISGFTQEIRQRCTEQLDADGVSTLESILESAQQMKDLIDALMQLSRLSHMELQLEEVDLSEMADAIAMELSLLAPQHPVVFSVKPQLRVKGDANLLKIALRKLLENAWKFTGQVEAALIEFGNREGEAGQLFYVRDNGAGFDMAECRRLFHPFQRLHDTARFPGNGLGLTTARRIIERHGGRIWAEGAPGCGATFYFTL